MQYQWGPNSQFVDQMANFCGCISTCPYFQFGDDIYKVQSKCQPQKNKIMSQYGWLGCQECHVNMVMVGILFFFFCVVFVTFYINNILMESN